MHQTHQVVFLLFDGHLTAIFDATKLSQFLVLPIYWIFTSERGRNITYVSVKIEDQSGAWTRDLWLSKQAALTIAPGLPP